MVEISEIFDPSDLESWLLAQDDYQMATIWVTSRMEMRGCVYGWDSWTSPRQVDVRTKHTLTFQLRPCLIAYLANVKMSSDLIDAAEHSVEAEKHFANDHSVEVTHSVCDFVAAPQSPEKVIKYMVQYDEEVSYPHEPQVWPLVKEDCRAFTTEDHFHVAKLYLNPKDESVFAELFFTLRERLRTSFGNEATARGETGLDWSFWLDWYEKALSGTENRWDMLEKIALLEDEVWKGNPSALMDQINSIWGRYSTGATPNAETILQDPEDRKYYSEPLTTLDPDDITDALDRIRDAAANLRGVKAEGNYCIATKMSEHLDRIDATVARYAGHPLRLYELCVNIITSVEYRILDGDLTAKDRHLMEFVRELERSSLDILNDDEEVARKVQKRGSKRIAKLNDAEKDRVRLLTDQAVSESKPEFGQELADSADTVLDDGADDDARSDAGYELSSRLTRMAKMKRDAMSASDDAGKVAKSGKAVWDLVTTVYTWFS